MLAAYRAVSSRSVETLRFCSARCFVLGAANLVGNLTCAVTAANRMGAWIGAGALNSYNCARFIARPASRLPRRPDVPALMARAPANPATYSNLRTPFLLRDKNASISCTHAARCRRPVLTYRALNKAWANSRRRFKFANRSPTMAKIRRPSALCALSRNAGDCNARHI